MKVRLLDSALHDLRQGVKFYERQNYGAGRYFLTEMKRELNSLSKSAGIHQQEHGCFRAIPGKFPYKIFYVAENSAVTVVAILDARRDPEAIRRRVESSLP